MAKKKVKKFRGSRTCGKGRENRNRGGGNRGGRGNAGALKHKYIRTVKLAKAGLYEIGKSGFTRPKVVRREYVLQKELKERLMELKAVGAIDDYLYAYLKSRPDLNVGDLDAIADRLVENGLAEKDGDVYRINLADLGYYRLLGSGRVSKKLVISVEYATPKAIEKVESAGGKIETES
ncbi:uL15 family ribosomal protein [Geoglobus acetivorans]|uniref:Large ribosomal subunit protein uL15 n=1 Tax=Geoglobus acetivorans TaxID=565033 RepID=A0A0A7GGV9_GEOAI|nr:LSU ribosomal protein L27Ae (L15p) [Geoglobus acetivorans]